MLKPARSESSSAPDPKTKPIWMRVAAFNTLACLLSGTGVTANCLHPGAVYTDLWRQKVPDVPACFQQLVTFAMRFVTSRKTTVKLQEIVRLN